MSNNSTEADTFTAAILEPQLNDLDYFNSVPQGMTALANRTRWLYNNDTGAYIPDQLDLASVLSPTVGFVTVPTPPAARLGTAEPIGAAMFAMLKNIAHLRSYVWGAAQPLASTTFPVSLFPACVAISDFGFGGPAGNVVPLIQNTLTNSPVYVPILGLPVRGTITAISVAFDPANTHGGLMPAAKPYLALSQQSGGGSATLLVNVTDSTATIGAYEAQHAIVVTGLSLPINSAQQYVIIFGGESSTNAQTGLKLQSLTLFLSP